MPALKRIKTNYPGVFAVTGTCPADGKPELIFYIMYRRAGRLIEEKAGRARMDDMTAFRANTLRAERMKGHSLPNVERRKQEQEAQKAAQEAEASKWTITRLWESYLKSHQLKGVKTDINRFENYLKPALGDREPKDLTAADISDFQAALQETPRRTPHKVKAKLGAPKLLSPATRRNVLELLRRIVNYGVKSHLIERPQFQVGLPTVNNERTEDLNPEQLTRLLTAIDSTANVQTRNLLKLALFSGMRRGELFALKWADVDFDRGFIHIRDPKGGRDQTIPLNDEVRAVLDSHPRKEGTPFVFPGRKGKKRTDIKKSANEIKRKAALPPDFRVLHGLRHVFASTLASSGRVDMYTLQKLLTHKSAAMTARYAHLRDDALRNASNLMGELVQATVKPKVVRLKKITKRA